MVRHLLEAAGDKTVAFTSVTLSVFFVEIVTDVRTKALTAVNVQENIALLIYGYYSFFKRIVVCVVCSLLCAYRHLMRMLRCTRVWCQ
jgi:Mg2+/Co2+ transporter CorB